MRPLLPFVGALLLISCSPQPPQAVLSDHQFARVYADLTRNSVSVHTASADTGQAKRTADSILTRYGVTRDQVLATVQQLNADPPRWKGVLEEALRDMQDSVGR
jgi:hypothetical protein